MSIPQLLHTMCAELPDADLNAIRKARGFSARETISRTAFASFYNTTTGVAENIATLTLEEAITLRLLNETGEVDVSFFERLYGGGYGHGTYTQRFKTTFEAVKKNLVRRGLVILAEVKMRGETVLLERWRFAMPPEFAAYLPGLPAVQNEGVGLQNDTTVRRKLLELVGGRPAVANDPFPITLGKGSICIQGSPFSLAAFGTWQLEAWQRASKTFKPFITTSYAPTIAVLKLLDTQAWTKPQDLEPALAIYAFGGRIPPGEKLLKQGWELGLLSRLDIDDVPHYRLAPTLPQTEAQSTGAKAFAWANISAQPGAVKIDLRLVPLHQLDMLNSLARLQVENGDLYAHPSLGKLGRATPAQRSSALSRWLAENLPAFGEALQTVNAKWGQTILHENLLVARVRDLTLRVQLERELKKNLIVLSDNYIAFPQESRASVEKVLKKTGFVIKTIKP